MTPPTSVALFETMVQELPNYLLSEVMFWQLGGPSQWPKLSLGVLLLTRLRLLAIQTSFDADERHRLQEALQAMDKHLSRWPVAAENKAARELGTRLRLWEDYWNEGDPDQQGAVEPYEQAVGQRTMAALLLRQFPRLSATGEALAMAALDVRVRATLHPGPFVWEAQWQTSFPRDDFWFLYGTA